jgi:hypothetical protein
VSLDPVEPWPPHRVRVLASGSRRGRVPRRTGACPREVWARLRERCQPAWPVAPDVGGIPVGPAPSTRAGRAWGTGCGDRTRPAAHPWPRLRAQAPRVQLWPACQAIDTAQARGADTERRQLRASAASPASGAAHLWQVYWRMDARPSPHLGPVDSRCLISAIRFRDQNRSGTTDVSRF